jgi:hypothetical protein
MSIPVRYAAQMEFYGGRHISRWRPLVQRRLAIPQLLTAGVLPSPQRVLLLSSLLTSAA